MSKIDEILDDYAQQYFQLLRTPSIEAKEIKERKLVEAKQAIYEALKAEMPKKLKDSWSTELEDSTVVDTGSYNKALDDVTKALDKMFGVSDD